MGIIVDKACGLDVHKETAVACIMGSGLKTETNALKSNPHIVCMDSVKKKRVPI